jgi:hypothetical protein
MYPARLIVIAPLLAAPYWAAQPARTEITKWQDGKDACISLTFDDSSINQFRIDIPLLNERGIPGTFFVVTGDIQGSKNQPAFVGRPMMEIIRESAQSPTNQQNLLERISLLNHLQTIQRVPELSDFSAQRLGRPLRQGDYAEPGRVVDAALAKLRQTGATYASAPRRSVGD